MSGSSGWVVVLPELRGCHGEKALDGIILKDKAGHTYLADHGWKRLIPDEQTGKLLGVSRIQTMSADEIRKLPTGLPLPPVRSKTVVNEVTGEMFLLQGGKRRYLQNASSVSALGLGPPFTIFSDYLSSTIPLGHMLDQIPNPSPIQAQNGPTYLLYNGVLHLIPNPQTQSDLAFRTSPIVFTEDDLSFLPRGEPIPPLVSNVIENQSDIRKYLLEDGMRRYIPDPPTEASLHLRSTVQLLPANLVKAIPEAAVIPSVRNSAAK